VALTPINAMMERSSLQGMFETFLPRAEARRMAELTTAIKFNLPLPKKGRKDPFRYTRPNPVKPSQTIADRGLRIADCPQKEASGQTGSNPVKPGLPRRSIAEAGPSETTGLPGEPQSADGGLQTAP
jgi:hypothetical protein